jgi:hypothetical protein
LRGESTVFDEGGNEIVLPEIASTDEGKGSSENGHTNGTLTPTAARSRRQSTITEGGFETALPSPKASTS